VPEASLDRSGDLAAFRSAGRTLLSLGLVKEAEGNLSTFDGDVLAITRSGAALADLSESDVLTGGLDGELAGASTDLEVHRAMYGQRGPGAIAHAHPPGTVPESGGGPGGHGVYAFAGSLEDAVAAVVARARAASAQEGVSS
jgi:ribulose-5-phosphate 4-epimerase/fuculose-1-phosphate aldolase